jgi:hypothetical protein
VRIFDLLKPLKDFPRLKVAALLDTLDIWDLRCVCNGRVQKPHRIARTLSAPHAQ